MPRLLYEAFHAYLEQKALEIWGSLDPNQWKDNTKDLTLSELLNYIEVTKNKNLDDISHDFRADNLDPMIPALKEFIDPNDQILMKSKAIMAINTI